MRPLMLACLLLAWPASAQEVESSLGTYPLPPVVGMFFTPPVTVEVRPLVCLEPGAVWVTLRIAREKENRAFTLVLESDAYRRATSREMDGEAAPRLYQFFYDHLPGGEFLVAVTVQRATGTRRASTELRVIPRAEPCDTTRSPQCG